MSKFTDRLKRLHSSRVRALSDDEAPDTPRVFVADEVEESVPAEPVERREEPEESPERQAMRSRLEMSQRIRARPKKLKMRREARQPDTRPDPAEKRAQRAPRSDNPIGERLTLLRHQAQGLIDAGRRESALGLLHEILALSPTHTFALSELAQHCRDVGDIAVAELYEERLKSVAPY